MPDPVATFEALIRRHQVGLWRYLRSLGVEANAADDLVQETFVVAWKRGIGDHGVEATGVFLRRTARNLFLRRSRDGGRREALLVELADRQWANECAADDGEVWLEALDRCLDALQPRARDAVRRWYGGDRSRVAADIGLEKNGLKTLLQRARGVLRDCIERKTRGVR